MNNCKYNLVCDRHNCRFKHDTIDGKSPVVYHCFFNYECTKPECSRIHSTLDGKSPSFIRNVDPVINKCEITITTWNILLDNLGLLMEKHYPKHILDPETRWKKIAFILEPFLIKEHIICLQEVTIKRIQEILQPLCEKYAYSIIGDENCMLVPSRFNIIDSNTIRIGRDTMLTESKYLPNVMCSVLLSDKQTSNNFYVSTYHMPCKYKKPEIMQAHLQQLVKILESAAFPVIFAGDMNMFPSDITIGNKLDTIWNHTEIVDTTFAHIYQEFKACIDNIFFTKRSFVYIKSDITPPKNLIPDETCPSDHVPLTCSFILT